MSTTEEIAGLYFMITTALCMFILVFVYLIKTKPRRKVLMYIILFLCTTVWGLTLQNRDFAFARFLNGIATPIIGGTAALIGTISAAINYIKEWKNIK